MPSTHPFSGTKRLLTALVLAAAAVPTVQAWRHQVRPDPALISTNSAPVSAYDTEAQWTLPNSLELQLRANSNADTLAELSRKIGAPVTFNSDLGEETDIARVTLPAGMNAQAALETLRNDPNVEAADVVHLYRTPEDLTLPTTARRP